jgi:hypothetical protein
MLILPRLGVVLMVLAVPMAVASCAGGGTGGSADASSPSAVATSTTVSADPSAPAPPAPVATSTPDEAFLASLIGLTRAEATQKAAAAGFTIRIASVDGKARALTMDYSPQRINVNLAHDKVTEATVG